MVFDVMMRIIRMVFRFTEEIPVPSMARVHSFFLKMSLCLGLVLPFSFPAFAGTVKSLRLYFLHTGEKEEIVFKRNGRYDTQGLRKVNLLLRDWRRNQATRMDPLLLDLLWETYRLSGSRDYIHVVSAYRSPETNSMLRRTNSGVARNSQHMLGKAIDFYFPDVNAKRLRNIGLKMQGGGVGYYPHAGSPFIHLDVGRVRHWPRVPRSELVAMFPDGKTLHVPKDGKPLPGYEEAMASYQKKGYQKTANLMVAHSSTGEISARKLPFSGVSRKKASFGLLATLFGTRKSVSPKPINPVSYKPAPLPADSPTDDKSPSSGFDMEDVEEALALSLPESAPVFSVNHHVVAKNPEPEPALTSLAVLLPESHDPRSFLAHDEQNNPYKIASSQKPLAPGERRDSLPMTHVVSDVPKGRIAARPQNLPSSGYDDLQVLAFQGEKKNEPFQDKGFSAIPEKHSLRNGSPIYFAAHFFDRLDNSQKTGEQEKKMFPSSFSSLAVSTSFEGKSSRLQPSRTSQTLKLNVRPVRFPLPHPFLDRKPVMKLALTPRPVSSASFVMRAPRFVYTSGFYAGPEAPREQGFKGKAVQFFTLER